ncbi:hypothetical protein ABH904_001683 [Pseudomonas frederiksbergensis]
MESMFFPPLRQNYFLIWLLRTTPARMCSTGMNTVFRTKFLHFGTLTNNTIVKAEKNVRYGGIGIGSEEYVAAVEGLHQ